jgi:signal peptidase I
MNKPGERPSSVLPSFGSSAGSFLVEVVKVILIALAIIIPVRYFLMQPFYVKGASMEPNFHDNEYLIIDEATYRLSEPKRGEVVVFRNPRRESEFYIKRLIGLPNERVEISHGQIRIFSADYPEGFALSESSYLPAGVYTTGNENIELGDDEFFVMGDNRPSSLDSRVFGPIVRKEIIGRIWIRAWPVHKMKYYQRPEATPLPNPA